MGPRRVFHMDWPDGPLIEAVLASFHRVERGVRAKQFLILQSQGTRPRRPTGPLPIAAEQTEPVRKVAVSKWSRFPKGHRSGCYGSQPADEAREKLP